MTAHESDRRLNELAAKVHVSRLRREPSSDTRGLLSAMLWCVAIGTILVLAKFVVIGSVFVLPAVALIGYLAIRDWPRRRRRRKSSRSSYASPRTIGPMRIKPAYLVHVLTATGIIPAALAMAEIVQADCDPRWVFFYLLIATLIDAIDGPIARRLDVKTHAASIDGRTIDDVLDYLTFAFIPLMLIWRMDWMPSGLGFTVVLAMAASLLGFAHQEAKDEQRGVFRGFPSYWNLYAIYAGIFSVQINPWLTAITLWLLAICTLAPIWVLYPNLAPPKWKNWIMIGGFFWAGSLLAMLWNYPDTSLVLTFASLIYPAFYAAISFQHARATTRTLDKLRDQPVSP